MKVKVNRLLSAGKYQVNFEVGDFTPEEISKMSSFGVPLIDLKWAGPSGLTVGKIPLNQINKTYASFFGAEQAAKDYEQQVLSQIRAEMERLRTSKDDFTSSEEVAL